MCWKSTAHYALHVLLCVTHGIYKKYPWFVFIVFKVLWFYGFMVFMSLWFYEFMGL